MRRTRFEARLGAIEMARALFGEGDGEGSGGAEETAETAEDRAERRRIGAALRDRGEIDG